MANGRTRYWCCGWRTPDTLIPRPETELLVETALELLPAGQPLRFADLGAGSGCIGVTLCLERPRWCGLLLELSAPALEVARANAARLGAATRLDALRADLRAIPLAAGSCDLLVSNPPYIKEEEKKDMERNVLDYEPHLALFVPDNDPLLYYWHIAHFGKKKLRRNGHLYFEINAACGNMVVEMLEEEGYKNIELIQDLSGRDRIIKARK